MDNNQYWKEKMLRKLKSFLSNYEFEVFKNIEEFADHVNLDKSEILSQIEKIKSDSKNLAKLIIEAKEK